MKQDDVINFLGESEIKRLLYFQLKQMLSGVLGSADVKKLLNEVDIGFMQMTSLPPIDDEYVYIYKLHGEKDFQYKEDFQKAFIRLSLFSLTD